VSRLTRATLRAVAQLAVVGTRDGRHAVRFRVSDSPSSITSCARGPGAIVRLRSSPPRATSSLVVSPPRSSDVGHPKGVRASYLFSTFQRRSYFTDDHGPRARSSSRARWWLRGDGRPRSERGRRPVLATRASQVLGYDSSSRARAVSILVALDPESAPGVLAAHRTSVALRWTISRASLVVRDRRWDAAPDDPGRCRASWIHPRGQFATASPTSRHVWWGAPPKEATSCLDARSLYVHAQAATLYRSSAASTSE